VSASAPDVRAERRARIVSLYERASYNRALGLRWLLQLTDDGVDLSQCLEECARRNGPRAAVKAAVALVLAEESALNGRDGKAKRAAAPKRPRERTTDRADPTPAAADPAARTNEPS
jgi:hypothetical protein